MKPVIERVVDEMASGRHGNFLHHLAALWSVADSENRKRIERDFADKFKHVETFLDPGTRFQVSLQGRTQSYAAEGVRIEMLSNRIVHMSEEGEARCSMLFSFTPEGLIVDVVDPAGEVVCTDSEMYDDILARLL
jgi:hypothetical protein